MISVILVLSHRVKHLSFFLIHKEFEQHGQILIICWIL